MLRSCFWSTSVSHPYWGYRGGICESYFPGDDCSAPPADNQCRALTYDRTICLRSTIPQSWPFGNCPS